MLLPRQPNELRIMDALYNIAARDIWILAIALHALSVFGLTYAIFALFRKLASLAVANLAVAVTFGAYLVVYFRWATFCC